jgi:acyl carrier protein
MLARRLEKPTVSGLYARPFRGLWRAPQRTLARLQFAARCFGPPRLLAALSLQRGFVLMPPSVSTQDAAGQPNLAEVERELASLFVQSLNLEVAAADIDPTAPLFGDGLGLDSIDILEVALEVSHRYGFQLRSDDDNNQQIFQSLRSLAAHVAQHRTQ